MTVIKAETADLPAILALQKLAYQSEALLVSDFTIPPLTQTFEGILGDYENGVILKAVDEANPRVIVGSVRGRLSGGTLCIGRLFVDPARQNRGIGTALLLEIESLYPDARYELYTSDKSGRNLSLYTKNGYKEFKREPLNEKVNLIFLEKYGQRKEALSCSP
ncbi:MAG: GNAT family N-acetyltransferase [Firmicutes bacterium]|nr:GNAT family N-acetyltransferase [Bacillota bacterium]